MNLLIRLPATFLPVRSDRALDRYRHRRLDPVKVLFFYESLIVMFSAVT
ncbi:MAG: hypothetical protein ACREQR_11145 [Candidatus Binataceae bacterium]